MEREEILKKLNEVFIDVLDDEDIVLAEDTTANDVDGWDSLNHYILVTQIEKAFDVKFTSKETLGWKNVGEMVDSIIKK